jgi:hypothetical protein
MKTQNSCSNSFKCSLFNTNTQSFVFTAIPCDSWECPYCCEQLKTQWKTHIFKTLKKQDSIFRTEITWREWSKFKKRFQRAHGCFFKLKLNGNKYAVYSDIAIDKERSYRIPYQTMMLNFDDDLDSLRISRKCISPSTAWQKPKKPKTAYKRIDKNIGERAFTEAAKSVQIDLHFERVGHQVALSTTSLSREQILMLATAIDEKTTVTTGKSVYDQLMLLTDGYQQMSPLQEDVCNSYLANGRQSGESARLKLPEITDGKRKIVS